MIALSAQVLSTSRNGFIAGYSRTLRTLLSAKMLVGLARKYCQQVLRALKR